MVKFFKALVFNYRLKKEIRKANERKAATGKKHFVLNVCGKPLCVSKEHVRELVNRGYYRKGTTVADIAKVALYKAR